MVQQQRKRESCRDCANWSSAKTVPWLRGLPDWCGEYAEPMRGDEPACAALKARSLTQGEGA